MLPLNNSLVDICAHHKLKVGDYLIAGDWFKFQITKIEPDRIHFQTDADWWSVDKLKFIEAIKNGEVIKANEK